MLSPTPAMRTQDASYSARLARLQGVWWKKLLDVQRPYRNHIRGVDLGFVLDLGCGIGRHLEHLGGREAGVGIDHNPDAIRICVEKGLEAYVPENFMTTAHATAGRFDSLLLSHVAEHLGMEKAGQLLQQYVPFVRKGGTVVVICPQEAGFASDPTHVELLDMEKCTELVKNLPARVLRSYSFPLPAFAGKVFKYNETVVIGRLE